MRHLRPGLALSALVGTLVLGSCGGGDDGGTGGLDGTYEITVAEEDATESGGAEPGRWTITISAGDATLNGPGGRQVALMPTNLSETEMVVPPDPMCPNNEGEPGEGVYDVESSDDSLEFTEVRDTCGDRAFTLTVHTWQRTTP